jgi:hypothetical protein
MKETGLPVIIADDPLTCVARGGGRILELTEERRRSSRNSRSTLFEIRPTNAIRVASVFSW